MSPARKELDPKTIYDMALCYVYDFESLSSIARRYGVSRSLVSDRLDHFWDSHDGHEMVRARSEEMGIDDDPLDPCECARCEAERETLARASNGRGSALHIHRVAGRWRDEAGGLLDPKRAGRQRTESLRELKHVGLAEALELTLLILAKEPTRFQAAALRWHARYCGDNRVSIEEETAARAPRNARRASAWNCRPRSCGPTRQPYTLAGGREVLVRWADPPD